MFRNDEAVARTRYSPNALCCRQVSYSNVVLRLVWLPKDHDLPSQMGLVVLAVVGDVLADTQS